MLTRGLHFLFHGPELATGFVDFLFKLEDPLDTSKIDTFFLAQALDETQFGDVVSGVATTSAGSPLRDHQAKPVILAQRLRVHPGKVRCHRYDIHCCA